MARSNQRGRNNNNPEGYNQHTGLMDRVRNHPIASAAAAGGAVAAGMFLWSKRDRMGEQMNRMGDKVGQWNSERRSQSGSSSAMSSGKRTSETGSERIGSGAIAGASAASSSSGRATGGRGGSASTGQNMNPSRTASETVSY